MPCDTCSRSEPSTQVDFHHNVGMLILRRVYSTEGELCRQCVHRTFWHHTLRNLTLGWWGTISFFMTWYYLVSNILTYVLALYDLGKKRPRSASRPVAVAGEEARRLLEPFEHNVRLRLRDGETPETVGVDLARTHGVEVATAMHFVERVRASG
jgi:hypothetical protein